MSRALDYVTRGIWLKDPAELPFLRSALLKLERVLVLTVRGFYRHRLMIQAAALTYYTVLSIVPVLAVSFAVARGLGAYDDLKEQAIVPFLDRFLGTTVEGEPVGAAAEGGGVGSSDLRKAVDQILAFVDQTDDLPLGLVGTFLFLYAAVKLLTAAEAALNDIWGIHRGRSWTRRFTDYVAFIVVTPILLLVGTAGMGWLRALHFSKVGDVDLGSFLAFVLQGAPFLVFWIALTFAYIALPTTRVRLRSAIMGGAVAALMWLGSQYLYIELQVGIAKYNALYASFAAFPIMLFWIFLSWAIFLVGAELSYAHQSVPLYTSIARMGVVDQAFKESLGLRLAGRITDAFLAGRQPSGSSELAAELGVSPRAVNQVLEALVDRNLLAQTLEGEQDRYLPARDPETITVADVLVALRTEDGAQPAPVHGRLDERIDRILEGIDREVRGSLHNYSLRELALAGREAEGEVSAAGELRGAPEGRPG